VLDGRKEEDPEYWLKHIETFGGDSPVLVAINKIDEHPGYDVNRKFLLEKYPFIKGFFRLSCKTKEGIAAFFKNLRSQMAAVEHLNNLWPQSWFNVKTQLEKMKENYISYDKYEEICAKEKIDGYDQQTTLVDYLNDLGVSLHFNDPALKETNVINPRWVTEAVYKIINYKDLADKKGSLAIESLKEILDI
ncbi:MAG: serine/threonine protein kinase, partial [bacterium]|nr:serine/threonine protein kinase [bacterium]